MDATAAVTVRTDADPRLLGFAAGAIANLGRHASCRDALATAGAVPPLVALCSARTEDAQLVGYVCEGLRNIARHEASRSLLVRARIA